ncbi:MAG: hypothetical protein AB7E52_00645 [Bdellovibrionales bacterium]
MFVFAPFFILSAWLGSAPAWAMQPNGCPDFRQPEVTIHQLVVAPRFNDTFNLTNIKRLAMEGGQTITSPQHETPVGITAASLKLETRYEVNITTLPGDPMVCAQISNLHLNFGFDDTTVYIAREIPFRSCSYQTVLSHEMKHVRTDRLLVENTASLLPFYLKKALNQIGVIRASSGSTAERQLKYLIERYMQELGANLSAVRRKQQSTIDTREEYDRISSCCNGALSEIIRSRH